MALYGFAAALFVVWSTFLGVSAYYKGRDSRAPEIASYQAAIKASEALAREAEDRASKAAAREVIVYKDKIRTIEKRIPGEVQLIETIRETTPPECVLPPEYRLLWDTPPADSKAAEGSGRVDGAPVTLADAAATAAEAKRRANLHEIAPRGIVNGNAEIKVAEEYRSSLNIKTPRIEQKVGNLSGGNQQKVSVAKWLFVKPDLLILDEPTRGIDVGAKYEIYTIMTRLVEQGR